jgi:N-terminal acetyltransferase B complex non-catalytic subunit
MLLTLRLRFRYTFNTSPRSLTGVAGTRELECNFCSSVLKNGSCNACLESIAKSAVWVYSQGIKNDQLRSDVANEDVDPFSDMAIIGATCLLRLAGLNSTWESSRSSFLQGANLKLVLQAIAWLNAQYSNMPVKTQSIPVLLTKLYILIGCISHAQLIWDTLGVKNVTLDSLGPLFSDRLSSIAPGMWAQGRKTPMRSYTRHFGDSITRSIPNSTRSALELGNYTSVLGMLKFQDQLKRSCTMVMAVVEDRRGTRAVGGKVALEVKDDPLLRKSVKFPVNIPLTDMASRLNSRWR